MIASLIPSLLILATLSAQAATHTLTIVVDDPAQWAGLQAVVAERNAEIEARNAVLLPPCAEQPAPAEDAPPCVEPPAPQPPLDEQAYLQTVIGPVLDSYAQQTGVDRITGLQAYLAIEAAGLGDQYRAWLAAPERTPEEKAVASYPEWLWNNSILHKGAQDLGLSEADLWNVFGLGRSQ